MPQMDNLHVLQAATFPPCSPLDLRNQVLVFHALRSLEVSGCQPSSSPHQAWLERHDIEAALGLGSCSRNQALDSTLWTAKSISSSHPRARVANVEYETVELRNRLAPNVTSAALAQSRQIARYPRRCWWESPPTSHLDPESKSAAYLIFLPRGPCTSRSN